MKKPLDKGKVDEFYRVWSASVYRFSSLFLGNNREAEAATQQAFLHFFRQVAAGSADWRPLQLFRDAVQVARDCCAARGEARSEGGVGLAAALLLLRCDERTVFILHGVLGLSPEEAAFATESTTEHTMTLWKQALMHLQWLWVKRT